MSRNQLPGMLKWLLALLVVALLTQGCETPQAESKRYADTYEKLGKMAFWNGGIFSCSYGERTPNEDSPTGYVLDLQNLQFEKESKVVPAELRTTFGMLFYLPSACTNATARFVYSYPPIKNPETGRIFRRYERERQLGSKPGLYQMVYTFAEEYELVEGKWTLQIFLKDKLVVEKRFTVVRKQTS